MHSRIIGQVTNGIAPAHGSQRLRHSQPIQIMLRTTLIYVTTTRAAVRFRLPRYAPLSPTLTRCLGTACMVILVGMEMNYGLLWVIYIKVVCGLRRSQYYKSSIITTPRNLPTVQPTCVQHGRATTTTIVVSTPVSLP